MLCVSSSFIRGLGLSFAAALPLVFGQPASAEVNAATLILAKTALVNSQAVSLLTNMVVGGVLSGSTDPKSVQDKEKRYIVEGMKKAGPGIISRLAKLEAAKFKLDQLGDIVELSSLTVFQKLMIATASGGTPPSESELSKSESATMDRLGNLKHVSEFIADIGAVGLKDKEVKALINGAVKLAAQ
jgi:hypothetical protein